MKKLRASDFEYSFTCYWRGMRRAITCHAANETDAFNHARRAMQGPKGVRSVTVSKRLRKRSRRTA